MSGPSSQYFARHPAVGSDERTVRLSLPDQELVLTSDRGVFSADRIDPGTRLLLQEAPHPCDEAGDILDLGCGYGPIAVTLARRAPAARVWAVDVNERAVGLCAQNATANHATNVRSVVVSDEGEPLAGLPAEVAAFAEVRFDAMWSNPPIRIGKAALHRLLTHWMARLTPGGRAWLVVQRHLGADSLATWLEGEGWATERLVSRGGYRLLQVTAR